MKREIDAILNETSKVISGKQAVIGKMLAAMLAGGHMLLDDVPGVGKTQLALALSKTMGLNGCRIQFTPDVLPSDVVGFSMYSKEQDRFVYRPGVVNNANLLLADEINRTSSRTQSALLEAMEEHQVTVDGESYPLCEPFLVIATQNNVGSAGTQPLPYAQMDRFMVQLSLGYPDHEAQLELLRRRQHAADPQREVQQVVTQQRFCEMQRASENVTAQDSVLDYISRLTIATREHSAVETGVSPRGALLIDRMAKAIALMEGRDYVIPQDVQQIFSDVCAHRLLLTARARAAGQTPERVLAEVLKKVHAPDRVAVR